MNPSEKSCWSFCSACYRCADKGTRPQCSSCSGHHDPLNKWQSDPDDFCDCRNGILRMRTQKGRLIIAKYPNNPYGGTIRSDQVSPDERDWEAYKKDQQERLDNPDFDPIQFDDGTSTGDWLRHQLG